MNAQDRLLDKNVFSIPLQMIIFGGAILMSEYLASLYWEIISLGSIKLYFDHFDLGIIRGH